MLTTHPTATEPEHNHPAVIAKFPQLLNAAWKNIAKHKNAIITLSIIISALSVPLNYTHTYSNTAKQANQDLSSKSMALPAILEKTPLADVGRSWVNQTSMPINWNVIYPWIALVVVVVLAIGTVMSILNLAMLLIIAGKADQAKAATVLSIRSIISYWWTGLLYGLIVTGGLLLFIVPGVIWAVRYGLWEWAYIDQAKSGMSALRLSATYVKGYWWVAVWRQFLGSIAVGLTTAILVGIVELILLTPFINQDSLRPWFVASIIVVFFSGLISSFGSAIYRAYEYNLFKSLKQAHPASP